MTIQFPVPTPINEKLFDFLNLYFLGAIETSPDGEALYNEFGDLIGKIDPKTPLVVRNEIRDMFMSIAGHYGEQMFSLGIMIGRDPSIIFDLPDEE